MRRFIFAIFCLIFIQFVRSQVTTQITHYSVDYGLSENHLLCMHQDSKGIMWFGTYDGLNKFDGYTFRCFKGESKGGGQLSNLRVDRIKEDKQGYLWLQTDDDRVYRFDSKTEHFLPVPQFESDYKKYSLTFPQNNISVQPDGSVWIYNEHDCFRIEDAESSNHLRLTHYSPNKGVLPSGKINKIFVDKHSNTWILTPKGICRLNKSGGVRTFVAGKDRTSFYSITENAGKLYIGGEKGTLLVYGQKTDNLRRIVTPFTEYISDLQWIGKDELFILTNTSFFYTYRFSTGQFNSYRMNNIPDKSVLGSYKDRDGNIWIDAGYPGGILFESSSHTIRYLPVDISGFVNPRVTKWNITEDINHNLWLKTRMGGIFRYNKLEKRLEPLPVSGGDSKSITNLVHAFLPDKQGNLWLNTYLQGVDKVVFRHEPFAFVKPVETSSFSPINEIRSVYEDAESQLWVGSKKGYVYVYDKERKSKRLLGADGKLGGNLPFDAQVYHIVQDYTGAIWLATKGKGLFKLVRKSPCAYSITNYRNMPGDKYSLSSDQVYWVYEDNRHLLWIGTYGGGLNLLDTGSGQIRFVNSNNRLRNFPIKDYSKVRCIVRDNFGHLLVGTTQGLLVSGSMTGKPEDIRFKRYMHQADDSYSISGNDVQGILPTRNGDLYVTTIGGGVNIVKGGIRDEADVRFQALKSNEGQGVTAVYTLQEDVLENVWMSSQTQVLCYHPSTQKFDVYKPTAENNYYFSEATVCQTADGKVVYGSSNGFVFFDPRRIKKNTFVPRIYLTRLQLFNKEVRVGEVDSPLQQTIDETSELKLTHKHNTFSIEFAAIDYVNPQAIQYAYKLEGLEKEWNYVGNQRMATYINLPKGTYTFRVKSTNSDGLWVNNEKSVRIVKMPSFWESAWGFVFYLLMFALFTLVVAYVLFTIYKLRNEVAVEQRITNMKLRFFTDISHELRTPLTLIASPVEYLLKKEPLSENAKSQLEIVQKNTNRMLRLINQILDFRKIQSEKMKLIIEEVDVAPYVEEICSGFSKLAEEKRIRSNIVDQSNRAHLWLDKDKFEKIIFNLLSNAFKFTPADKSVDVIIYEDVEHVSVTVKDQGTGIARERLKLLFERFESFASRNVTTQSGTGIGLSLTKELVELHHASIEVESETGKGSAFRVIFRKGNSHFGSHVEYLLQDKEPAVEAPEVSSQISTEASGNIVQSIGGADEQAKERFSILITEDNSELRAFLKSSLCEQYEIYEAENGREACELALSYVPDLIISDIMMPDMDGIALARIIKQDLNTSHIPFILLTAKTDMETKLDAMALCVDDYITKPFSLTYLEARIENLLKIRGQLQSYFKSSLSGGIITLSKPEVTNLDEAFISKTIKFIEENYDNAEMNIDDISASIGVSRSSFFKKIKGLTGMAPVDFIREFRLQKAAQMLEAGETNISQIAFNVGMNDTKYFSRCFKQKFGMNPSEYKSGKKSL